VTPDRAIWIGEARGWEPIPVARLLVVGATEGGDAADYVSWAKLARGAPRGSWEAVVFIGAEKLYRDRTKTFEHARRLVADIPIRWATLEAPPPRPVDWWALVDLLRPGYLGRFWDFVTRYCAPHRRKVAFGGREVWELGGEDATTAPELRRLLEAFPVFGLPPAGDEAGDATEIAALAARLRECPEIVDTWDLEGDEHEHD
jgi:hypothetical protein